MTDTTAAQAAAPEAPDEAGLLGRRLKRFYGTAYILLSFVAFFLLWEMAVWLLGLPSYLLPAPSLIAEQLAGDWEQVIKHAWYTTREIIIGFGVSVAVGIPLAMLVAFSHRMERTVYPIVVFLTIVPKIAVAPLFIIWFGFGLTPKVLLVFLLSFFPIMVSSVAGFKSIDTELIELAKSSGASNWLTFRKIRLPHALPSIFTGLKVAATISATAAVVAEFVGSDRGLGYLLLVYNGNLETPMVFASIIVLTVIGLLVYYAVEILERLIIPWHVSVRGETGSGVGVA